MDSCILIKILHVIMQCLPLTENTLIHFELDICVEYINVNLKGLDRYNEFLEEMNSDLGIDVQYIKFCSQRNGLYAQYYIPKKKGK